MSRGPGRPPGPDGDRTRIKILEAITERPGSTRTQLSQELGYQVGTIRFHLRELEKRGAVRIWKKGRAWTYYRRDVPSEMHLPLAALAQRRAGKVLHIISGNPGLNESQVAERSPWSRKVIHRLLADLEEGGLVKRRPGFGFIVAPHARTVERFVDHQTCQGIEVLERLVEGKGPAAVKLQVPAQE